MKRLEVLFVIVVVSLVVAILVVLVFSTSNTLTMFKTRSFSVLQITHILVCTYVHMSAAIHTYVNLCHLYIHTHTYIVHATMSVVRSLVFASLHTRIIRKIAHTHIHIHFNVDIWRCLCLLHLPAVTSTTGCYWCTHTYIHIDIESSAVVCAGQYFLPYD